MFGPRVLLLIAATFLVAESLTLPSNAKVSSRKLLAFSDVPRETANKKEDDDSNKKNKIILDWKSLLPPPPEDQFILTGDISVLFMYAFTSHFLNNFLVQSILSNSDSIQDALNTLDPMREVVTMQNPVWVQPDMIDTVLAMNAEHTLMNHWGPLFSTAGSSCVALCSCWLLAGWFHRAFSFQNSLNCDATRALQKTFETWITAALLMCLLTFGSNTIVSNVPFLQTWLGCVSRHDCFLTKADTMFLVDSATVLIAWRYTANSMMNYFR